MIANKHISKIIIAITAVAVLLCFLAMVFYSDIEAYFGGSGVKMEYETKLFDTNEIISVDIQMDESQWDTMLANASSEEYYVCDVVINGLKVNNVAIRPKGNTSLSSIAMDPDSDRFSLKLEFDHFVDGQTCWGLDKLILNNNYADATNMKEALIYDMYQYIGAEASLYNYAKVCLNGEYWGVYLALEGVEDSFMLRNFGTQDGELYKPDNMEMGGGDEKSSGSSGSDKGDSGFGGMTPPSGGGFSGGSTSDEKAPSGNAQGEGGGPSFGGSPGGDMPDMNGFDKDSIPDMGSFDPGNMPDAGNFNPGDMPDIGNFDAGNMPNRNGADSENKSDKASSGDSNKPDMGGFSPGGKGGSSKGGADLNYTDDDLDSYSTIWEGEITGTGDADHRRVVTALKKVSEGTNLEKYLDVDNVLKYMAVHTFAVNMDSLSGSMAHNYYLYEYKGQLNLFPWDYNLSFGGMSMGSSGASGMINDAIDTPFAGTHFFDALLSNETYLKQYHAYLQQLVDEYVDGGRFDETYNRIRGQIDELVATDPTAFYTNDEYQNAVKILYDTIKLRAESIRGQLDGTIPSTDDGQREDSSALIDASGIDVEAMGQFDMGGFSGDSNIKSKGRTKVSSGGDDSAETPTESSETTSDVPDAGGFSPGNMSDMSGFDAENMPDMENFDPGNMPNGGGAGMSPGGFDPFGSSDTSGNEKADNATEDSKRPSFSGMPGQSGSQGIVKNLITIGICLIVMIAAFFIIRAIKRKK